MGDVILVVGLAWWFGGTYFGTQHRLRKAPGSGSLLAGAPRAALYGAGLGAALAMLALARTAQVRMEATDAGFGVFVFGAVLCAVVAGCSLGAARA